MINSSEFFYFNFNLILILLLYFFERIYVVHLRSTNIIRHDISGRSSEQRSRQYIVCYHAKNMV